MPTNSHTEGCHKFIPSNNKALRPVSLLNCLFPKNVGPLIKLVGCCVSLEWKYSRKKRIWTIHMERNFLIRLNYFRWPTRSFEISDVGMIYIYIVYNT